MFCIPGADILEVGFGRGVASDMIQARTPGRHTIIECNPHIVAASRGWMKRYPDSHIEVIEGMWQDVTEQLDDYDGIFFHTYPLNDQDYVENVAQSVTFAEHFFRTAAGHLRKGGAFTYLSNEADSLGRAHQRALLAYFESFTVSIVRNLDIPEHSRDSHWTRQMIVVRAKK